MASAARLQAELLAQYGPAPLEPVELADIAFAPIESQCASPSALEIVAPRSVRAHDVVLLSRPTDEGLPIGEPLFFEAKLSVDYGRSGQAGVEERACAARSLATRLRVTAAVFHSSRGRLVAPRPTPLLLCPVYEVNAAGDGVRVAIDQPALPCEGDWEMRIRVVLGNETISTLSYDIHRHLLLPIVMLADHYSMAHHLLTQRFCKGEVFDPDPVHIGSEFMTRRLTIPT